MDSVKLIGTVYLMFCCYLSTLIDVNQFEPSAFTERISWIWPNNIKVNRDAVFDTSEMIRKAGYPVETHVTTTADGYHLTLHRIPGDNDSLPVLLQHGFLATSAIWIFLGKGKGLAYILADHGYDVWLGNFRGNIYSRTHISLSPSNSTFWDFSLNELGIYDLPATITYITNMTSQPLHTYIGISMGSTCFYMMAIERPEIAQMVKVMISLAPTVFINHMTSPIQNLFFLKDYKMIMRFFFHEFLLNNFVRSFLIYGSKQNILKDILANMSFIIFGNDHEQFDYHLLPFMVSHFPAGGSFNTFVQLFQSGKFRQYDYGRAKNILIYNSIEPPEYNLTNITMPIALLYGPGDLLDNIMHIRRLYHLLPNVVDIYQVPWRNFNHADFVIAKDAPKLVYERVLKIMRMENSNNVTSIIKIKDECYALNLYNNGYD